MAVTEDWKSIAAAKRESQAAKIPAEWRLPSSTVSQISAKSDISVLDIPAKCGLLSERELEFTEKYDATALVELMVTRGATSYEVTRAFCKRAAIAHQLVNCCTEIMFEEALVRAKECDDYLAREGKPIGPLHGLPVSLKDSFEVKGTQAIIGYVSFISRPPAAANSSTTEVLLRQGAVFYVKTNIPQSMMTADSDNNVFGRTLNPNKLTLTAGGSTGGEGALIKLRGSVLGVATDIAGSIRIPSLCNGVMGFKPTAQRIPFGGVPPGRHGSPAPILPVVGPISTSPRDMNLFMKSMIDADPWEIDPGVIAVPWRTVSAPNRPLRFGLIKETPERPILPPVQRAMHTAATALKSASHAIVLLDDKVPSLWDTIVLAQKFFLSDPKKTPLEIIKASGEPFIPSMAAVSIKELNGWAPSLDELFDLNVQRMKIVKAYHDLIVENQLDAILMPGNQATAVPHDTYGPPPYTVLANLLNYPAALLPFLHANQELDTSYIRKDVTYDPPYNPEAVEGAPSAIQLMGRPMKDEELVRIMEIVNDVLTRTGAT